MIRYRSLLLPNSSWLWIEFDCDFRCSCSTLAAKCTCGLDSTLRWKDVAALSNWPKTCGIRATTTASVKSIRSTISTLPSTLNRANSVRNGPSSVRYSNSVFRSKNSMKFQKSPFLSKFWFSQRQNLSVFFFFFVNISNKSILCVWKFWFV